MTDEYLKGIQAKTDAITNPTLPTGKAMTAEQGPSITDRLRRLSDYEDEYLWELGGRAADNIDAQAAELKAQLATARESALEEAAKICEAEGREYHERFTAQPHQEVMGRLCASSREQASYYCARAIRALK